MRGLGLLLGMIVPLVAIAECPDGYTEYLGPSSTQVRNSNGVCVDLCGAGITSLNTSNGYKFDLFASRNTTPSIHVKYGDVTCYADLIAGQSDGTLNVAYNNSVYHATLTPGEICPAGDMFKITYDCGDGATGTPPTSVSIKYNELYMAPYTAGGCVKPGYYFSGWKMDDTTLTRGEYYNYTYEKDKTMVAQWTANAYAVAYLCNNGTYNSSYLNTTFGGTVTPSSTVCSSVDGATFAGWRIKDVFGNDTGDTVASGSSFTWNYPYNIQLVAIWE